MCARISSHLRAKLCDWSVVRQRPAAALRQHCPQMARTPGGALWRYAIISVSRPCQECGCGEVMARESKLVRDYSKTYFINCNGEDLRSLNVNETFELCQADYPEKKLYFDTWLVFY